MEGSGFLGKSGNRLCGAGPCKLAFMSCPEFCPKKECVEKYHNLCLFSVLWDVKMGVC